MSMTVRASMKGSVTLCMEIVPVMLGGLVHTVKKNARKDTMEWIARTGVAARMEGHVTMCLVRAVVPQAGLDHCVKNHAPREHTGLPAASSVTVRMVAIVIL